MEKINKKLITQSDLNGFYGTNSYHSIGFGQYLTDGCLYLANKTKSFWLFTDIIALSLKINDWLVVAKLKKIDNNQAELYLNDKKVFEYEYTDIWKYTDIEEIKVYYTKEEGILLLPSEY